VSAKTNQAETAMPKLDVQIVVRKLLQASAIALGWGGGIHGFDSLRAKKQKLDLGTCFGRVRCGVMWSGWGSEILFAVKILAISNVRNPMFEVKIFSLSDFDHLKKSNPSWWMWKIERTSFQGIFFQICNMERSFRRSGRQSNRRIARARTPPIGNFPNHCKRH
jgi:hypothetical protein